MLVFLIIFDIEQIDFPSYFTACIKSNILTTLESGQSVLLARMTSSNFYIDPRFARNDISSSEVILTSGQKMAGFSPRYEISISLFFPKL